MLQVVALAVSVAAGLAAVLGVVAQLTAGVRLRRRTEHLQGQFQATELSDYDRGIALSLHREATARLVALHALPVGHFVIPLFLFAVPGPGLWAAGRALAESSDSGSLGANFFKSSVEGFGDPVAIVIAPGIVFLGLLGLLGVILGRREIEQDYLHGKSLHKEPSYGLGLLPALLALGRSSWWLFLGAIGLCLLVFVFGHSFEAKPSQIQPLSATVSVALLIASMFLVGGFLAIGQSLMVTGRKWHHEPLSIKAVEPSAGRCPPKQRSGRLRFWQR